MAMIFSIHEQPRARLYAVKAHIGSRVNRWYLNFNKTQTIDSAHWEREIVDGCLIRAKIIAINFANLLAKQSSAVNMRLEVIACVPVQVAERDTEPREMGAVA